MKSLIFKCQTFLMLVLAITGLFLFCSCEKDHNDNEAPNERLVEAIYTMDQSSRTVITTFSYEDEKMKGYNAKHIFEDFTIETFTEIEYTDDSVVLSTFEARAEPVLFHRCIRYFENGILTSQKILEFYEGEIIHQYTSAYEYQDGRLIRHQNLTLDSIFYGADNKLTSIKSYNLDFGYLTERIFNYEGGRISLTIDSLWFEGTGSLFRQMIYTYRPDGKIDTWGESDDLKKFYYTAAGNLSGIGPASYSAMWITYKYEPGKGNADYLFSDPLKKLYGVCETYLAW